MRNRSIELSNNMKKMLVFLGLIEKMYFFGRSIDFLYLTLSIVYGMFIQ